VRAAVLQEIGKPMMVEEIPRPAPKDHEVLVKVVSTGVCRADLHVIMAGIARHGVEAHFEITPVVRRKISIDGSYGGRPGSDMPVLLRMLDGGQLDPGRLVSRRYSLDEAAEAYDALDRGEIVGRALIVADDID
jgi:Zn-dependent alcohol dehydrogenase